MMSSLPCLSHSTAHASQISAQGPQIALPKRESRAMSEAHAVQMSMQSKQSRMHSAIRAACSA